MCERGRALSVFSCLRCLLYIRYIVKTIVMCVKNIANRTNFDTMDTRGKRLEIRCKPVCRRIFEPGTRYHAIKRGRSCIRKTVLKQVRWCMPIPAVMRRIWSNKMHCHNSYEIYYMVKGNVEYFLEGTSYVPKPGSLLIIPPNCFHGLRVLDGSEYHRIRAALWCRNF